MEQQQFRVSFSLGTKLLISVVLLLAVVITFLNFSTIVLMTDDKRAYTFQAQSAEATLAGREFLNLTRISIETLRQALVSPSALKNISQNQSDLAWLQVGQIDKTSAEIRATGTEIAQRVVEARKIDAPSLGIDPKDLKSMLPDLLVNGFTFINVSKLGGQPMLAVVIIDVNQKDAPGGVPMAAGITTLSDLAREIKSDLLTVSNRYGRILFDTDPDRMRVQRALEDDPLFTAANAVQFASGVLEYEQGGVRYLGSYYKPGYNLVVLNRLEWRKAMQATYSLIEKFILLGMMAIGVAVVFAILFSRSVTAPLQRLYQATKDVGTGNFNVKLEAQSKDEIGALTDSFNIMSKQINELILEKVEKVYLENELAIASMVQQTLIPPSSFANDRLEIFSLYQAASQCGGDWWGFFMEDEKFCVMIADATGHGLPSALITASARSCFSVMQKLAEEEGDFSFSPSSMLSYANRVVHDSAQGQIMMTFFVGVLDFRTGKLSFASAGHNPPWLFRKEGDAFQLKSLTATGQRLGEATHVPEYEEKTIDFAPGDILFLYTDGLTEGKNLAGEMYGKKRVRKLVEAALSSGPQAVIEELHKDAREHNKGKSYDDDISIACARIKSLAKG